MRQYLYHLRYLLVHKWCVLMECRRFQVPLWIALWHDWDKFLPDEFIPFARCYFMPDDRRQYQPDAAFKQARLLHLHRSKHHWQFWYAVWENSETECLPMPDVYRREMLADWFGAGRSANLPDILGWYTAERDHIHLHPDTRAWVEAQLGYHPPN
jgi:hypothetical protein